MVSRRQLITASAGGAILSGGGLLHAINKGQFDLTLSTTSCSEIDLSQFERVSANPILNPGASGHWDDYVVSFPHIVPGSPHKLYYVGKSENTGLEVGVAFSEDMIRWTRAEQNPVLSGDNITHPQVWQEEGRYYMVYQSNNGDINLAESHDGIKWLKRDENPIFTSNDAGWTKEPINGPGIIKHRGTYHLFYHAHGGISQTGSKIGHARSTDLLNWADDSANPILSPSLMGWDSSNLAGPRPFLINDRLNFLYRGTSDSGQAIGRAVRCDGAWNRTATSPILMSGSSGQWDEKLVEHVTITTVDDTFYLFYSGEQTGPLETDRIGLARFVRR